MANFGRGTRSGVNGLLSKRTRWERLAATAPGALDLTEANPTVHFAHPAELFALLGHADNARYTPEPFGLPSARAAVQKYYARRGRQVPVERIVLTASTSEAYHHLFSLLCDPGDVVAVPQPSYPLFDCLADVAGVRLAPYPLVYADGWHIDRNAFIATEARAIIVVNPNNPTGHYLTRSDFQWLCEQGLPLIIDEVFADYPLQAPSDIERYIVDAPVPCFTLSGLSKVAALPQLKLGWMVASGDCSAALDRLEVLLDTFLSLSTPVQTALDALLVASEAMQRRIHDHVRDNLTALMAMTAGTPLSVLRCEGGWSAILQTPERFSSDQVTVTDGAVFGISHAPSVVVSLLTERSTLERGVALISQRWQRAQ